MTMNTQQTGGTQSGGQGGGAQATATQAREAVGQAQQKAQQGARETADKLSAPTQEAVSQFTQHDNPVKGYEAFWEKLPTNYYFLGAGVSMALSALLLLAGKQKLAIFIGLWPMTILNGAVMMKALRPSQEV